MRNLPTAWGKIYACQIHPKPHLRRVVRSQCTNDGQHAANSQTTSWTYIKCMYCTCWQRVFLLSGVCSETLTFWTLDIGSRWSGFRAEYSQLCDQSCWNDSYPEELLWDGVVLSEDNMRWVGTVGWVVLLLFLLMFTAVRSSCEVCMGSLELVYACELELRKNYCKNFVPSDHASARSQWTPIVSHLELTEPFEVSSSDYASVHIPMHFQSTIVDDNFKSFRSFFPRRYALHKLLQHMFTTCLLDTLSLTGVRVCKTLHHKRPLPRIQLRASSGCTMQVIPSIPTPSRNLTTYEGGGRARRLWDRSGLCDEGLDCVCRDPAWCVQFWNLMGLKHLLITRSWASGWLGCTLIVHCLSIIWLDGWYILRKYWHVVSRANQRRATSQDFQGADVIDLRNAR